MVGNRYNTPITVQVVQGNIALEETDAIVNPTDQFLLMNAGVATQLLKYGGKQIEDEAR